MKSIGVGLHLWWRILSFLLLLVQPLGLNRDGILLLSLKYSVLSDPHSALESWNYYDETPCSWNGVRCSAPGTLDTCSRVISLSLANSRLLGSIPDDLGTMEHLQNLDLSNNALNGTLPLSLFNASKLQVMDLSNNLISGELPEVEGGLQSLQLLNLSDNALAGRIPEYLSTLNNLTSVSLKNNYFSGSLPTGFSSIEVLDLSSNLINGSLPSDFGGENLRYLNISYNRLAGPIPLEFAQNIPGSAVLDLSFNNLTGQIPESDVLYNQLTKSFSGNTWLCGKPLKVPCPIPSTLYTPSNTTEQTSPPAIAAMPKTIDSTPEITAAPGTTNGSRKQDENGLRPATIVGIVLGDIVGVGILAVIILYVYQRKKKKNVENAIKTEKNETNSAKNIWSSSSSETKGITAWSCLPKRGDEEDSTETTSSEAEEEQTMQTGNSSQRQQEQQKQGGGGDGGEGALVTVDGEKELELETLLKASAYILGATGSSIMYKAVLEDGTTLAVRRIGESGVERFRDFENQVKIIAKLVHPNLVRIRGFYWGVDEKLVIYDFVPNGSLASARYRKIGSSPCHMPWEIRLKVAKGVARGLNYLHDKKHVHANLKPSNILLGADMDPKIGDFGLERLVSGGDTSYKAGASARNFGSKRSTASRDSFQDIPPIGPSPSPSPSSLGVSPYHAPESLRSLKPNPKWDVFSFGIILLELLTGKVIVSDDLGLGLAAEDKTRVLKMADPAIRADLEGKEDFLLACLKLGFNCVSPTPQKRPSMKEAVQVLDKIPSSSSSSSSSSYYYAL